MKKTNKTLLLLDGNALLHRAWHALPPLTTKDGRVVNAAYGFAMVLEKMLERFKPDYMVVAWDLPGKTFRHEKFAAYKAQREEKEPELYAQIPIIQEILSAWGVPSVSAEGFEADDVIGTLSTRAKKDGIETIIVTGDQDQLQLVDDTTRVEYFLKGISETKTYDRAAVKEKFGLTPEEFVEYKALRGDPSDNIPGVAGVGEKTATELLQTYGSIDGIYQALADGKLPEKFAKKFEGKQQVAHDSLELVTIVRDMPLKMKWAEAEIGKPDMQKVLAMYRELDFRTLLKKHADRVVNEIPAPPKGAVSAGSRKKSSIEIIRGSVNLDAAIKSFGEDVIGVYVVRQPADLFGTTISAVAVTDAQSTLVVPNPTKEHIEVIGAYLDRANRVVGHDIKALMHALSWRPDNRWVDVMLASYLLHSGSRAHDLASVVAAETDVKLAELPEAYATDKEFERLGEAVRALPGVWLAVEKRLQETDMLKVFVDIEMPLVAVLFDMEQAGVELDVKALEVFSKTLGKTIEQLERKIVKLAGEDFNVNSPSQLATVLFEKLGLPTKGIKKTQSGFSTAASELEKLEDAHEIVPLIGEYREVAKLQSTYVEALPKLVGPDGRIHTTYNQTIAATGRLSSVNPNLQNIPIKTDLGNEIRKAFVAPKGMKLLALDYSQIELRLAAVIAKDAAFIKAFQDGADIHTRTAAEVWGVEESKVTSDQRRAAKAINFGILYGMGSRSLARSTGMSNDEAKDFIDRYFQIHHAIRDYLDNTKIFAREHGYVQSLFGRRRYLPEIQGNVPMLIAMAERMAINMPIQGTAADIMKMAMLSAHGWLTHSGWPAKMLLQVHDELVIECAEEAVDAVARGVKGLMEGVASFEVPLAVNVEVGDNWGEMEAW